MLLSIVLGITIPLALFAIIVLIVCLSNGFGI